MKLTFYGAAHEVTGSCHLLETSTKKILFDCGMFQGSDFNEGKNHDDFPFDPKTIDVVLVSHAHLDHVGRIPKLVRDGFEGRIFMTKATAELAKLVWDDALEIMEYNNRKFQAPILYSGQDVALAIQLCHGINYDESFDLGGDVRVVFRDAGHIFGSSFIEVTADGKTVAFSGDLGNADAPIVKDTEMLGNIDVLLMESTYGDRHHEAIEERKQLVQDLMVDGAHRGGTIMIPSFSIERTQELLFELHKLSEHDGVLPKMPIFLDSPLAIDAMKIYKKYSEYYDEETNDHHENGEDFLNFPQLRVTYTREESKTINSVPGPKVVIAGAGMMNGGRILHHALRYLSDPRSTLIFVGYQAQGTLGRKLYEGAEEVTIFGERVSVLAKIKAVGGLSAHADQVKLIDWVSHAKKKPLKIYCVHGEAHAATELAHRLRDKLGVEAYVPELGQQIEI